MGALKMESAELRSLGQKIVGNADSFDGLISGFQSAYTAITASGTWDGDDSDKFNEACTKFKSDLDHASSIVRQVGTDLVTTADDYDATHESVSGSIGSML